MKLERLTQYLLTIIALALVAIALRPLLAPTAAQAQDRTAYSLSANGNVAWIVNDGRISAYRINPNANSLDHVGSTYIR